MCKQFWRQIHHDCTVYEKSFYFLLRGHSKSMFAQDSRVLTPLCLCSSLFLFEHHHPPPPLKVHSFWLELLTLNFYTFEIQRKEINDTYQYFWLNSTCLLRRSHSGIYIKQTPLVHDKSACALWLVKVNRVPFIGRTEYYNLS